MGVFLMRTGREMNNLKLLGFEYLVIVDKNIMMC